MKHLFHMFKLFSSRLEFIDLITKWLAFQYSFVRIQISPSYLVPKLKQSKEYFALNKARRASLNVDKRILKWKPF